VSTQFWLGLAVLPAIAAIAYILVGLYAWLDTRITTWRKPWWTIDDTNLSGRARVAADVAWARRKLHIALPFGVAIIYRTKDDREGAWGDGTVTAARWATSLAFTNALKGVINREAPDEEAAA